MEGGNKTRRRKAPRNLFPKPFEQLPSGYNICGTTSLEWQQIAQDLPTLCLDRDADRLQRRREIGGGDGGKKDEEEEET